jgi:tetratricopeptide (TPR) repeat protein
MAKQFTAISPDQPKANASAWGIDLVLFSLLVLLVWIVFGQTLGHEFVNVDDDVYVTENAGVLTGLTWRGLVWAFTNLQAGFWHPLTWLSLMADAQVHGLRAGGFHLTNVLLHTANTLLLFILLRRLTGARWRSAFVAALFAIHPLHVEAVAWVSERKGLLSMMFLLLSLRAYARYARMKIEIQNPKSEIRPPAARHPSSSIFYLLSLSGFACALMSKTMVVTLPAIMLLLDYWPLRRVTSDRWQGARGAGERPAFLSRVTCHLPPISEKIPFFGLACVAAWLTFRAEKDIGALAQGASLPLTTRLANAAVSCASYLSQTVWPADLAVFYPYPSSFPVTLVIGSLSLLALISLATIWLRRRFPYLAIGWFWFVITLAPVSGLIQVGGHTRADRYTYLPLVGIFLIASWGLADLCNSWRHRRAAVGAASVAVLAALLVLARAQTTHWRDSVSLWTHALACAPDNPEARHNLGDALAAQGKLPEAIQQYELARQLKPDHVLAHNALGIALATQGRLDEAIPHFETALQLKPNFAVGHYNLSVALAAKGKLDEALQQCETAIRLKPDYAEAHHNLGVALAFQGRTNEAMEHLQKALNLAIAQGKPALADTVRKRLESNQTNPLQPPTH